MNTYISNLIGQPGPLTGREAMTRFIGVGILFAVGYVHLMDISHKIEEGVWYMAFLFSALIVSAIILAVALVKADDSRVRFIWAAAALLAIGAMFGYFVSRAIALPGMADHQGDWFSSNGIFAWLFELGLVGLAAFALRDRVVRIQSQRRARRRARVAVPAMSLLGLLGLQPAAALAHNGEEMTPEEMAAAEMGHDPGSMDHSAMNMSHDSLLGGTELGVIFALGLALIGWAGMALRARVAPAPRTRRSRPAVARASRPRPQVAVASQVAGRPVTNGEPPARPLRAERPPRPRAPRRRVSPA